MTDLVKNFGRGCAIASSLMASVVSAQELDTAIDYLVVTGERREVALNNQASSISILTTDDLARIGADHPSEALNRLSGVLIHRGSGQEHLTAIRSPVLTGGAGAGSFLFLQDGVPLRSVGFANVNGLFEAHTEIARQIEVEKGPSGAFYGANAIHGTINVLLPEPGRGDDFLQTSVDTIGRLKSSAVIDKTVGQQSLLAGVSVLDDPGFRVDSGVDQQKLTLRHRYGSDGLEITSTLAAINLNQETAGFVQGRNAYQDAGLRRANPNPEAFRDVQAVRVQSQIEKRLSDTFEVSITPYGRWTDMDFKLHFLPSDALEENTHWSLGAQAAGYWEAPSGVDVAFGVDGEYTEGELTEFQDRPTIFSFTQGLHYDYEVEATSLSPFARASVPLTEKMSLELAGRLDWTSFRYDNRTGSGTVGRFLRPDDRRDSFVTFSPKIRLTRELADGLVWASYTRGARPPQTTDLYRLQINQTTDPAEPETIDAAEIGVRKSIGNAAYVDLAGYYMVKDNFFFRDADGFNVSDGRTRHVGGEASFAVELIEDISWQGSLSYGAHTYRFDRPLLNQSRASEIISAGNDVDTAPRWLGNMRLRWSPEERPVSGEIEWVFVDDYFLDAGNTESYPGHSVFNLRSSWQVAKQVSAFFALRNVLNTFYAERADFAFGNERYFPGEGRVLTVGFSYRS